MRIIFVRHAHPNYTEDCLTEIGHMQAVAVAKRLKEEGIQKIYSSSCGRAVETAEYTAREISLHIEQCDFAREIVWGSMDGKPIYMDGHPWRIMDDMVAKGQSILKPDWMDREPFCHNKVINHVKRVTKSTDTWLSGLGYEREGDYYRVGADTDKTVAMFSHGGSSGVMLAHIFNLPYLFVGTSIRPEFTAITIVNFSNETGVLTAPKFELVNDTYHLQGVKVENMFGQ